MISPHACAACKTNAAEHCKEQWTPVPVRCDIPVGPTAKTLSLPRVAPACMCLAGVLSRANAVTTNGRVYDKVKPALTLPLQHADMPRLHSPNTSTNRHKWTAGNAAEGWREVPSKSRPETDCIRRTGASSHQQPYIPQAAFGHHQSPGKLT